MFRPRFLFVGILLAFGATGCSNPASKVGPADGIVKIDGVPAANLLIQLVPQTAKGETGTSASAVSNSEGRFSLVSDKGLKGAAFGTYRVTVVDNNLSTEGEPGNAATTVVNRVPKVYMSAASTPLTLTIEKGKSEYEILISSAAK